MKLTIASPFRELFTSTKHFFFLRGGRSSGKTTVTFQYIPQATYRYQERDIVVCRDSYSDLIDSTYSGIKKFIYDNHIEKDFEFRTSPIRIYNITTKCNMYFLGIGGADKDRTKSFEPEHKLSVVVVEELQQVKDRENLEQAMSSFRRHLDSDVSKVVHIYNPPAQNSHWTNIYWNFKKQDIDWVCINSDYRQIVKFLNDIDLKEILKMKIADEPRYRWMYLGETGGGFGSIYPEFKRAKHFRPYMELLERFGNTRGLNINDESKRLRFGVSVQSIVIGVDGAVTHDATCAVPLFLMTNGQIVVPEIFYHDPLKDGQKSSAELLPYIQKWLYELEHKYFINSNVPVLFSVDSAASELIRMLRYHLPERYDVYEYGKQTIMDMVGVMQTALSRNMCYFMDFGGIFNYTQNHFVHCESPLVVALENLIWNDAQTGYDKSVPNDASDALTYGINQIFRNLHNLYSLQVYNENRKDFYDLEVS